MRLSHAILLGSVNTNLIAFARHDSKGGACALGMAENATGLVDGAGLEGADKYFQFLHLLRMDTAPCGCSEYKQQTTYCEAGFKFYPIVDVASVIAHISNEHILGDGTWTLDRLAQWVASIEPSDSPESVTNPQETSTEKVTV